MVIPAHKTSTHLLAGHVNYRGCVDWLTLSLPTEDLRVKSSLHIESHCYVASPYDIITLPILGIVSLNDRDSSSRAPTEKLRQTFHVRVGLIHIEYLNERLYRTTRVGAAHTLWCENKVKGDVRSISLGLPTGGSWSRPVRTLPSACR